MDKNLKKLKSALYRAGYFYIGYILDDTHEKTHDRFLLELERRSRIEGGVNKFNRKSFSKEAKDYALILSLVKELKLTYYEVDMMWSKIKNEKRILHKEMKKMPRETRDNKGVIIKRSDLNPRAFNYPWRYPSKKRSLRTWKIFYEMFPQLAKFDEWDGKQSKRRPLK